jgi:glycerol-3-phosphate dehydrogenase (NAD(P)+)
MEPAHDAITVLGGGSFGTTLAVMMAEKGVEVTQWVRDPKLASLMRDRRENTKYLPGVKLPLNLWITENLGEAATRNRVMLAVVPSQAMRALARDLAPSLKGRDSVVVSLAKGLEFKENGDVVRMSEVLEQELPKTVKIVCMSGPNLSHEIVAKNPSATVIASKHRDALADVKRLVEVPWFKVLPARDVAGVELGGVLKNIVAIAAGMSDGLGFGRNTKSAIITLGVTEMWGFGKLFGAKKETFWGLAGLGDVIATCHSRKSRNHHVGEQLARGEKIDQVMQGLGGEVAEGVTTTKFVYEYAQRHALPMPLTQQVYEILYEDKPVPQAVEGLLRLI